MSNRKRVTPVPNSESSGLCHEDPWANLSTDVQHCSLVTSCCSVSLIQYRESCQEISIECTISVGPLLSRLARMAGTSGFCSKSLTKLIMRRIFRDTMQWTWNRSLRNVKIISLLALPLSKTTGKEECPMVWLRWTKDGQNTGQ